MSLAKLISEITGISETVLRNPTRRLIHTRCVAERMSWASSRSSTRLEDRAYSLIGIFDLNMPLLYGEGERAFYRLQENILRSSEDYTLFAWRMPKNMGPHCGLLAPSPGFFPRNPSNTTGVERWSYSDLKTDTHWRSKDWKDLLQRDPPSFTSRGLKLTLLVRRKGEDAFDAYINCFINNRYLYVQLRGIPPLFPELRRYSTSDAVQWVPRSEISEFKLETINATPWIRQRPGIRSGQSSLFFYSGIDEKGAAYLHDLKSNCSVHNVKSPTQRSFTRKSKAYHFLHICTLYGSTTKVLVRFEYQRRIAVGVYMITDDKTRASRCAIKLIEKDELEKNTLSRFKDSEVLSDRAMSVLIPPNMFIHAAVRVQPSGEGQSQDRNVFVWVENRDS